VLDRAVRTSRAEFGSRDERFHVGVNYWPARTAMSWWANFNRADVAEDFARISAAGLDSVRIFLLWEDFQPAPDTVDREALEKLVAVVDLAGELGLAVIPTLFTGHMSGVNWVPAWALGGSDGDARFRVVSRGRVVDAGLRNWYVDPVVGAAQALLASEAAAALSGHPAVWAWDLGNENSNCVLPPTAASARTWLSRMTSAIRSADPSALVTVGLHMEDLEEDRRLGPAEAAEASDFLSMHGYPIYAAWANGPTDDALVPFLAHVTRWLGPGRDVLFTEFGLPTFRGEHTGVRGSSLLVEETTAAVYTAAVLEALRRAGCLGAMLWCYSDYDSALWGVPPLDLARHERTFGLWRADGSPKPSLAAVTAFAGAERCDPVDREAWIDIDRSEFLRRPSVELPRLYRRYRSTG
jgi:endo-1,4-beta-mannosidase